MSYILEHYSVAIRKRKEHLLFDGNMSPFEEIEFPFSERYWAADPFIIEHNSIVYLFYELFDNVGQKGVLAYSTLSGNKATSPTVILDKPYHLSFPNVFQNNGKFYMIPETAGNHCIELYRADDFPNKWVLERILVNNINVCDTVVSKSANGFFLLTSEMDESLSDHPWCYVKNRLFFINRSNVVDEIAKDLPVGDFGIRNGGAIIAEGELIRVGQDCTDNQYGRGLVFWKLSEKLEDIGVKKSFSCNEIDKIIKWHDKKHTKLKGTHTYNISEHYEVIDTSEDRQYSILLKYVNWAACQRRRYPST